MKPLFNTVFVIALLFGVYSIEAQAEHGIDGSKNPGILIVVSGSSGVYSDGKITLKGVPSVVYFSERPGRVSGHISLSDFEGIWNDSQSKFSGDPPNAALSVLGHDSAQNAVIELLTAEVKDNSVSFKIKILQGKVPESFGPSSLFIDNDPYGSIFGATAPE